MLATRAFTASRVGPSRVMGPMRVATIAPVARPLESSSFMGVAPSSALVARGPARGSLVVLAAKNSMACTTHGGTNKKRRTTSGFRARMQSATGAKVLKARRKKGRHVICPASQKKSGGKK